MKIGQNRRSINEIAKLKLALSESQVDRKYAFKFAKYVMKDFKKINHRFKMSLRK